jgi:hypothetical protein
MPLGYDLCNLCYEEIRAMPLYYRVTSVNSSILVGGVSPHILVGALQFGLQRDQGYAPRL